MTMPGRHAGNGSWASTVRLWDLAVISLLAVPCLDRALKKIAKQSGGPPHQRHPGAHTPPHYSGKHCVHGLLYLVIADCEGR
ncbi:hypothetical protein ACQEVF_53040 [Nonomuraea polychroma]|uniref:hypothetical protein n=1 Tax=Nonomuraea polychroma TaxID=46176 RepID=UPI003D8F72A3